MKNRKVRRVLLRTCITIGCPYDQSEKNILQSENN
jgi:hypothetical protein